MKFFLASLLVVAIAVTATQGKKSKADWEKFKADHGKSYDNDKDSVREHMFQKEDEEIEAHNSKPGVQFKRAHNKFSDMTKEEKDQFLGAKKPSVSSERFLQAPTVDLSLEDRQLPTSLDYRTHKCLPAVKNQGNCGSCWAFAAIAPLEFSKCNKTGSAVVLSEQQLVDCDPYDSGCNGGWYTNAWYYIQNVAKGSAKQSLYTYTATQATCKFSTSMIGAQVSLFGDITANNAPVMQASVQRYGPLAVAIAVVNSFFSYASGVYTDPTCDNSAVNHAVVVVGWGTSSNGIPFWIVRNSWGTGWGQLGYILMQRGVNKCKIESYPSAVLAI